MIPISRLKQKNMIFTIANNYNSKLWYDIYDELRLYENQP